MAIKFEKIKPGMTLYDVRKNTGLTAHRSPLNVWPVEIVKVDTEQRRVWASWNGNSPLWIWENRVTKYRAKRPEKKTA